MAKKDEAPEPRRKTSKPRTWVDPLSGARCVYSEEPGKKGRIIRRLTATVPD